MSLVIRFFSLIMFFLVLVVNPVWSWKEVSVASTYSSAILGLLSIFFFFENSILNGVLKRIMC